MLTCDYTAYLRKRTFTGHRLGGMGSDTISLACFVLAWHIPRSSWFRHRQEADSICKQCWFVQSHSTNAEITLTRRCFLDPLSLLPLQLLDCGLKHRKGGVSDTVADVHACFPEGPHIMEPSTGEIVIFAHSFWTLLVLIWSPMTLSFPLKVSGEKARCGFSLWQFMAASLHWPALSSPVAPTTQEESVSRD